MTPAPKQQTPTPRPAVAAPAQALRSLPSPANPPPAAMPSRKRTASARPLPMFQQRCKLAHIVNSEYHERAETSVPLDTEELSDAFSVASAQGSGGEGAEATVLSHLGPEHGYVAQMRLKMPEHLGYRTEYTIRVDVQKASALVRRVTPPPARAGAAAAAPAPAAGAPAGAPNPLPLVGAAPAGAPAAAAGPAGAVPGAAAALHALAGDGDED